MEPATFDSLAVDRPLYRDVDVQAWGRTIRLRRLTAIERLDFSDEFGDVERLERADAFRFGVRLLSLAAVDGDGRKVFDTPESIKWLECEAAAVMEILDALLEHNEMGATARTAAKNE